MQSVHPTANTLVSHLSLDAREVSFSSRESIEREVPQPLVEACEDLYGKNVRVHRVGLATDGDLTASLWVDADHLSLHNRLTALGYGDETVIPDRPAIRMDFRYSERTTSQELSSLTLAATRRFEPQEATWIESWSPEEIRRRALFSDKTTEEYAMELGYYRDHRGGRYYRSYELWIKAYPDAGAQDANLRKIPGYALLSPEARRLLARQYSIYSRLCDLSPETVTATRHKIGLRLLTPETLVHGTRYDHEKISSIASRGILSSEFRGGNEKRMCRYCSEFFRVPRIMSVREYVEYYHTPEAFFTTMQGLVPFYVDRLESELFPKRSSDEAFVAFFIDTEHGDLSELLDREAYR
ncbi:MAG TPA: hypothetical protein PK765_07440 [bacterium]|nr:hypothetical protein [bacterium]